MQLINTAISLLLLWCGTFDTYGNQEPFIKSAQGIDPIFNSDIFRGAEFLKWRKENINASFAKIVKTAEGIYIPEKTIMVDIRPPSNEFMRVSLGIGRILKDSEKNKLPKEILNSIYNHYIRKNRADSQDSTGDFIAIAFAEAYHNSVVYNKDLSGTLFLALIKVSPNEFQELKRLEDTELNNQYINVLAFSAYFVLFYRDASGKYHVLKAGAAG